MIGEAGIRLETVHGFGAKRQLKSFVPSRLMTMGTNGIQTALGNFRSVGPEVVIRKHARLRFNSTVSEYTIAVLAVQRPLSLRHSVTFWRGAGLAVTNIAKTQPIENVQKGT